jgi:hypothetical protein
MRHSCLLMRHELAEPLMRASCASLGTVRACYAIGMPTAHDVSLCNDHANANPLISLGFMRLTASNAQLPPQACGFKGVSARLAARSTSATAARLVGSDHAHRYASGGWGPGQRTSIRLLGINLAGLTDAHGVHLNDRLTYRWDCAFAAPPKDWVT